MRFCGTTGGKSFMTAQRPEVKGAAGAIDEYACPTDFKACSTDTSFENTICVATDKVNTECPITTAKFVKTADYSLATYPAVDYVTHEVDSDYKFVTSTTKGDNLPLTSFKVETKPCLDHKDTSRAIS